MEKKAKCKPECWYKQKAIIDIGRNRVSEVRVAFHTSHSPDLAPSDFCLFHHLKGTRYSSDAEMQTAVSLFFCFQFREFYETNACKLISCWLRYVVLDGGYVEV